MAQSFVLMSDSSCDLPQDLVSRRGIRVLPFYIAFPGEGHLKEGEEIEVRAFYQRLVDHPGEYPKTSMPSTQDYYEAFLPHAQAGEPVLCLCITSQFSGSYNAATTGAQMVREECPQAQIEVVDTAVNTVLQGLVTLEAADLRDRGLPLEEARARIEEITASGRIFFTISGIDYLLQGGRIGKLVSLVSGNLKINPLITLKEGKIFPSGIALNRLRALRKVTDMARRYMDELGKGARKIRLAVGYGFDYEEAVQFRDRLAQALEDILGQVEIPIFQIGATIAVHTGPQPLGVGIVAQVE